MLLLAGKQRNWQTQGSHQLADVHIHFNAYSTPACPAHDPGLAPCVHLSLSGAIASCMGWKASAFLCLR